MHLDNTQKGLNEYEQSKHTDMSFNNNQRRGNQPTNRGSGNVGSPKVSKYNPNR